MSEHDLRHLAVISGATPERADDLHAAALASCTKGAEIAREAFALIPDLNAFSWLDPGLDEMLSHSAAPFAAAACAAGAKSLAAVATDLGVALRICGRIDDLPPAIVRTAHSEDSRTLLWFQRYSGRDEIVRAGNRYLAANPGTPLADGDLDRWLDTAGIPDPDMLLYIGGPLEPRDVLLWQGSYAEISHTSKSITEFTPADLHEAIKDYTHRQRRFGR